jgi:hypothetical protein
MDMRTTKLSIAPLFAALACGGDDGGRGMTAGVDEGGIGTLSAGTTDDGADAASGDDGIDEIPDIGNNGLDDTAGEECASYTEAAENKKLPADIIVVVDNSGSMDFEALSVQDNLNTFSQQIIDSGIDVHVVLMSSYPGDGNGMCIGPPLGVGGCPGADTNPPAFLHIDTRISSNDALEQIIDNQPVWSAALRPEAPLHIVIVTDDESDLAAIEFDQQLRAFSPDYADYKLHGIVCTTECDETAAIGDQYIALGQLTGGIISDLCLQDFQPVFDQLATEVVAGAEIACEWDVPLPPEGEAFDPLKVNVEFDDGAGGGFEIGYVESEAECANVVDGWYYDDPVAPTKIFACAQTCQKIQGVELGTIQITLGCDTVPAG